MIPKISKHKDPTDHTARYISIEVYLEVYIDFLHARFNSLRRVFL